MNAPNVFRYTNPITRDPALAMRDHFILKVGKQWFMTGTSMPVWSGPNPGVRLLVSDDLLNWRHHAWLIDATKLPDDCPYKGRFWASEIHRAHGKFWLTVNSGHRGKELGDRLMDEHNLWLFMAERIDGEYKLVRGPLSTGFKNDANLFTDDDGQTYIYCSGGGLWQARIDLATGQLLGKAPLDATTTPGDLRKIVSPRDPGNPDWMIGGIEGPYVLKREGTYFMFFSAWTRGYEIGVLRAPTPLGPWTLVNREPIFGTRKRRYREAQMQKDGYAHLKFEDTADPYVEVGHNAVFEGPDGRDWICCHYFLEGKQPVTGSPVPEYLDSQPQLGIEPLHYSKGQFSIVGPTWTEQAVKLK
ncbi:MAG: family 43 glycosylhydrolase [Akkermansiaceae bacterium]|nr:family 43 glycosylhydrolase [Verrucomicrobiales bacterium]